MTPIRIRTAIVLIATILMTAAAAAGQSSDWVVLVNGTPVTLSRPVQRIGGDLFLPLEPVVRALGFNVSLAPDIQGIRVRRGTSVETTYDGRTGEIRYGPIVAAQLTNFKQIAITEPVEDVVFPLSGLIPLLAVDVRQEQDQNVLHIDEVAGLAPLTQRSGLDLSQVDYSAGMTVAGGKINQFAALHADALANGASLKTNLLLSGSGASVGINEGNIIANLSGHRTFTLGDQTAFSSVDSLVSSVRGIGYGTPVKGFEMNLYGGRSAGATRTADSGPANNRYDTTEFGATLRRRSATSDLSIAATDFAGPERGGMAAGIGFTRTIGRQQLRTQMVAGRFLGLTPRTALVSGFGSGLSFSDTFAPIKPLAITAQIERYSQKFLTARQDSQFNGQFTQRLSMTAQPFSNLSLFGGVNRRAYLSGTPAVTSGFNYGAMASVPHLRSMQFSYFKSKLGDSAGAGRFELSQYSIAVLNVRQFFANATYSDIQLGKNLTRTMNATIERNLGSHSRVGIHDQLQLKNQNRYGAEWNYNSSDGRSLRVGVDRLFDFQTKQSYYVPIVGLAMKLPRGQRLQLIYTGERGTHMLSFVIGGRISNRQEVRQDADGRLAVAAPATLEGRVFDSSNQTPLPDVSVSLDDATSVKTDANGNFHFDHVNPGAHRIRADLVDIPANMVFVDDSERHIAVLPYRKNVQDFPVVRTGSVSGKVSIPEARIIADSEHDTYSDSQGNFILSSLPPGTYRLTVDPQSIPSGYAASPQQIEVRVRPAEVTRGVQFELAVPAKTIVTRDLN
jgi:hypothetical protein